MESNLPISKILNFQKFEAELSIIKRYIKCEISGLNQKIDSVRENFYETLKDMEQRERKHWNVRRPFTFSGKRTKF